MYISTTDYETADSWKNQEAAKYPANRAWYAANILQKWYCILPAAILIALYYRYYWQNSIGTSVLNGILAAGFFLLLFPSWFAKSEAVWRAKEFHVLGKETDATGEYQKIQYSLETLQRDSAPTILAYIVWATAIKADGGIKKEAVAFWRNKSAKA